MEVPFRDVNKESKRRKGSKYGMDSAIGSAMKTKLICCDVDSTLVDDFKRLSARNRAAIRKAVLEEGIQFAIISGRIAPSVRHYMDAIGITGVIPSLGGCLIEDWDGTIIEENVVDGALATKINNLAKSMGCLCFAYHRNDWYVEPGHPDWVKSETDATETIGNEEDLTEFFKRTSPNKLLGVHSHTPKVNRLRDAILAEYGALVDCFLSSPMYLEIVPKGVNKGTAVDALCRHYGIKKGNVLAIGDYYNDIDMLKIVGVPVTVKNAPDDIKAVARYVTKNDCNHSAVAEALERFIVR